MRSVTIERSALVRAAGLTVGIMRMNPDPADPAARLAVCDIGSGKRDILEVRAGDHVAFAGRLLTVTGLIVGPPGVGRVELNVTDPPEGTDGTDITGGAGQEGGLR